MSYFLPSFFQKRILRYALSRLELLDTDTLDLENLEIGWGRKSTVELRDVNLHTKKLSSLLKLPPNLAIVSAQILFLRLTVPADLYKSGILVEVQGVRVHVNADLDDRELALGINPKANRDRLGKPSKGVKGDKPRSNQSHVHDPGGSPQHGAYGAEISDDKKSSGRLPTTDDLAKSFLQAEPKEEKAELQASVANLQNPDQSQMTSDGENIGVGNNVSLPAFLADFLKGVGNRVQVEIQDAELDLTLRVDRPPNSSSDSNASDRPEHVTLRLAIGTLCVDGVTFQQRESKGPGYTRPVAMQEARRVALNNAEILVISEASLFADLARSAVPSSPETNRASSATKSHRRSSPSSRSNLSNDGGVMGSPFDAHPLPESLRDLESPKIGYHGSIIRAPESFEEEDDQPSSQQQPADHFDSILADSLCSSRAYSQDEQAALIESENLLGSSHYPNTKDHIKYFRHQCGGTRSPDEAMASTTSDSFPSTNVPDRNTEPSHVLDSQIQDDPDTHSTKTDSTDKALSYSPPNSDRSSPDSQDLTESKIFTHEEASVYMSAISLASHERKARSIPVPGNWDSAISDHATADIPSASIEEPWETEHIEEEQSSQYKDPFSHTPKIPRARTAGDNADSSAVLRIETESFATTSRDENSSSQGSETSSANLKSPFAVSKKIVGVDWVVAMVPLSSRRQLLAAGTQEHQSGSRSQHVPGSFGQASGAFTAMSSSVSSNNAKTYDEFCNGVQYSVDVGEINVLGDVGLTRMMILVGQRLNAFRRPDNGKTSIKEYSKPCTSQEKELRLMVKKLNWEFLEAVKGEPVLRSHRQSSETITKHLPGDSEILLRANVKNLHVVYEKPGDSSTTKASIGKFCFGYCSDDIVSFDSGLKLRASTRDLVAPVDNDIILTVTKNPMTLTADLNTIPLHMNLDLRRLDETFSWFGGFSSMLGLGSSMMSTMTVVDMRSKAARPSRSTRGVHFESPDQGKPLRPDESHTQKKVTARIGGLSFDVQGTQSSLHFETTALKIVSRTEGLGLQVDRLKLSGPYLGQGYFEPSMTVQLVSLRVEYLPTPKEVDLARLLALLSPSKDKDARDDDILLETLLRQRRQGAVVRATVEGLESNISKLDDLRHLPLLAEDLKKLSTVTKYLPEDDRPGLLVLGLVKNFQLAISINDAFGLANLGAKNLEGAYVTFPTLMALAINNLHLYRNKTEELFGTALPLELAAEHNLPTIMARFIGNEMEPTAKIKIHNLRLEYHVSTIMAIMGLGEVSDTETVLNQMISSVTTITSHHADDANLPKLANQGSTSGSTSACNTKQLKIEIAVRDSIIGLNPRNSTAKGLLVLTDTDLQVSKPRIGEAYAVLEMRKASIMVIDDVKNIAAVTNFPLKANPRDGQHNQVAFLSDMGYVSVGLISAAKATIQVFFIEGESNKAVDVEIRDDLFVLESCADSTQTLQVILNGLQPPVPPSTELKYMTEVVPIEDMLASLTGDAFATTQSTFEDSDLPLGLDEGDLVDDEVPQNLEFVSGFYNPQPNAAYDSIANSVLEDDLDSLASPSLVREIGDKNLVESFQDQAQIAPGNPSLDFREDHFGTRSSVGGTARGRNTKQNTHGLSAVYDLQGSPLRVRVRDVHIIWNLFDGYDWQHTRETIGQAVENLQNKASERLAWNDKRKFTELEEEEESVIGDFLFNSIYIGIPANRDPRELAHQVNRNLDDLASESESYATSTSSASPTRQGQMPRIKGKKLRLTRSRYHKMTFELKGVSADMTVIAPGHGETRSSIDVRIRDLEIFDHVPTSTWKKFATYMHDAGERQNGTSMVHLQISTVKPVPHLAASEIILKATILPLRLHVDQDALDFLTRFFEFKDDAAPAHTPKAEAPFFQRVEVNSVQVKLDFKPKRVDYSGIRSGHTTEFMNFFVLDRADMVLRHVIIYGVLGLDKLGKTLNDIWMPDVKRNQLPGILAGLAPVRSLVNVGGGVRDLVAVPIREYQKDGRIVRSFQKGALAFAKTTTSELVKLGAKLAIGTQTVLQGAEDLLSSPSTNRADVSGGWEDAELDEEEKEQISRYADQPIGVVQGLRGAYASLERDLVLAKDAIIAMPGEALESGTAGGAARAVLRGAPTVILRPAMGVSKAVGQTLMGATNSLDPANKRRIEDKYKRH